MNEKGDAEAGDVNGAVAVSHASNENNMLRSKSAGILLRLASAGLCVVALVLMVLDKEVHDFVIPTTPPIVLSKSAKYSGAKALVFFVWVNGVVAAYLLLHAMYSIFTARKASFSVSPLRLWLSFLADQLLAYLLLAAAAAATEVAYIAERGDNDAGWEQECNLFGKFCNQVGGSIVVSYLSLLGMIALVMLSACQLFSSEPHRQLVGRNGSATKNFGGRT